MSDKVIRCTDCAAEFTEAETENIRACPTCGSTSLPCAIANDVTLRINWHEIRILGIWASNYATTLPESDPTTVYSRRTLDSLLRRLQAQHPDKAPLTLAGELRQVAQELGTKVELHNAGGVEVFEPPEKN